MTKEEQEKFRRMVFEASAAVTRLQSALDLPFRPVGLQPIVDLQRGVDELIQKISTLEQENNRMFTELWMRSVT